MSNPVVHFEFWSKDPNACSKFYEEAFGWQVHHIPEMEYHLIHQTGEGGIGGGIMKPKDGPWPGNMALYLNVEKLGPAREKVIAAGGKIIVEEQEVPGTGKFCLFEDPDGRVNGIWEQLPGGH